MNYGDLSTKREAFARNASRFCFKGTQLRETHIFSENHLAKLPFTYSLIRLLGKVPNYYRVASSGCNCPNLQCSVEPISQPAANPNTQ